MKHKIKLTMTPPIHLLLLVLIFPLFHHNANSSSWVQTRSTTTTTRTETLTKLHFYFHDVERGPHKTVAIVAKPENSAVFDFGTLVMVDEPLTVGPDRGSKLVGRAQGMYGVDSQSRRSLLMTVTFEFLQGRYNGSTVSVMGRYNVDDHVRELAVVGGSGVFRLARGYVVARRCKLSGVGDENTAEFDVFVLHSDASSMW